MPDHAYELKQHLTNAFGIPAHLRDAFHAWIDHIEDRVSGNRDRPAQDENGPQPGQAGGDDIDSLSRRVDRVQTALRTLLDNLSRLEMPDEFKNAVSGIDLPAKEASESDKHLSQEAQVEQSGVAEMEAPDSNANESEQQHDAPAHSGHDEAFQSDDPARPEEGPQNSEHPPAENRSDETKPAAQVRPASDGTVVEDDHNGGAFIGLQDQQEHMPAQVQPAVPNIVEDVKAHSTTPAKPAP